MLWDKYDSLILDLDGVVYIGSNAVPFAIESLNAVAPSVKITAATNNASRHRSAVAAHLRDLDLDIHEDYVITSSDAAAEYLCSNFPHVQRILVVGGDGLANTLQEKGLEVMRAGRSYEDVANMVETCDVIVEGHGTDTSWWDITAVIWALQVGKPWIATNRDMTVPLPFGTSIGNGGFVSLIEGFTKVNPIVTGKPEKFLFETLMSRLSLKSPLVIGDSFHTDIKGAQNAGLDSLLVLTGVSDRAMIDSNSIKPTYVAEDLRVLLNPIAPQELG
jgi:glycerol 3-phosphatase-2